MSVTAFPLAWPTGWPRQEGSRKNPIGSAACGFPFARNKITEEIRRIRAQDEILSTNCRLLLNGQPRGDQQPGDPGVALYFTLNGKSMVMATDYFTTTAANIWRLAMALAYLRGLERHGGGTMLERAFAGFAALPDPNKRKTWHVALGLEPGATLTVEMVEARYRELARLHHPDRGGSVTMMAEINQARDEARRALGAA